MDHVFISYVREDVRVSDIIAETMRSNGIRAWVDKEDLPPESVWIDEIRKAISHGGRDLGRKGRTSGLPTQ
jgi:hypothetical protein